MATESSPTIAAGPTACPLLNGILTDLMLVMPNGRRVRAQIGASDRYFRKTAEWEATEESDPRL